MWGSAVNNGNIFLEETSCLVFLAHAKMKTRGINILSISLFMCVTLYICVEMHLV